MVTETLQAIRDLVAAGGTGALVTPMDGRPATLVRGDGTVLAGPSLDPGPSDVAATVGREGVPRLVEEGDRAWFIEPIAPPPRLLVFGAIAVADTLVPMAAAAGFSVEVIDPRPWLASPERHPAAARVHCGDPGEVVAGFDMDASTAVVSFLHEPHLEDPVLVAGLVGGAGYVGAMGSRRTTLAKRERLAAAGLDDASLARLHAPIGIDIGSVTPQEIAVSVLAQIVAGRHGLA